MKFCLGLPYNGSNGFLFINTTEVHQSKAKDSKIKHTYCVWEIFQKTLHSKTSNKIR